MLNEQGIEQFMSEMKTKKINVENMDIKFNPFEKYALVSVKGLSGIEQEEDYYSNVEENMFAAELSWLEPICKALHTKLDATIPVLPNGDFDRSKVEILANLNIPKEANIYTFLYQRLRSFVLFYPFIDSLEIRGHKGKAKILLVHLVIDTKQVTKILKNKENYNKSIMEHWLYIVDKCERDNYGKERFEHKFKVINGKVDYQTRTELVTGYFGLTHKEING